MMKNTGEKNYYELLNISRDATDAEIDLAFEEARKLYGEDSVAIYSLYSQEEREAIMRKIYDAYEVLKDAARRKEYDSHISASDGSNGRGRALKGFPVIEPVAARKTISKEALFTASLKAPLAVTGEDGDNLVSEQYRILYTKLEQISARDSSKTFAITSAVKGEGKTVTAINLACMMAGNFKKKVALVELDLRNPTLSSEYIDTFQKHGIADVLRGEAGLGEAVAKLDGPGLLYVFPALKGSRNSTEMLNTGRVEAVMEELKPEFDYILIDCPPILNLADMNMIGKVADGLVMVVRAGKTPRDIVARAISSLPRRNVAGVILNGVDQKLDSYSYTYY